MAPDTRVGAEQEAESNHHKRSTRFDHYFPRHRVIKGDSCDGLHVRYLLLAR